MKLTMTISKIKCWSCGKSFRKYAVIPTTIAELAQVRKCVTPSRARVTPEERNPIAAVLESKFKCC